MSRRVQYRERKKPPKVAQSAEQILTEQDGTPDHVRTVDPLDDPSLWTPSGFTLFKLVMSMRISAALWSNISDCDEVYNYWEPLHLLLFGSGMQTWEYSPVYALRSYAYVLLHYAPAKLFLALAPHATKVSIFYFTRCFLGCMSAVAEVHLFCALRTHLSRNVSRLFALLTLTSSALFISSTAFLPSSFAMICNMHAIAFWLQGYTFWATLSTAASALLGWPFAAVLGLPIAADLLLYQRRVGQFVSDASGAGLICGLFLLKVDTYFYGRSVLAPLNIIMYNIFSAHGPTLYGVEPPSYYVLNNALNLNVIFPLALLSLPLTLLVYYRLKQPHSLLSWTAYLRPLLLQLSLHLWLAIFFSQPHKEERFMFPVYPLFCVCAALSLDAAQRFVSLRAVRWRSVCNRCVALLLLGSAVLSASRAIALYRNYHAPLDVYMELPLHRNTSTRLCLAKEWHRYPSSFILPSERWNVAFVKSRFDGLLPKLYESTLGLPGATRHVPDSMNDANREEMSHYVPLYSCDFLVDFQPPPGVVPDTLEPDYAADETRWRRVATQYFLYAPFSNRLLRAFYIPFLSDRYNSFGNYVVLERLK